MRQASHARVSVNSHGTAHLFFLPHVSIESAPYVLELVQGRHVIKDAKLDERMRG